MAIQHYLLLVFFAGSLAFPDGTSEASTVAGDSNQSANKSVPEVLSGEVTLQGQKFRLGSSGLRVNVWRASEICQLNGWELVKINNQADNNLVIQLMAVHGIGDSVWTAGTRLGDNLNWRQPNGHDLLYFSWTSGEPNNAGGNEKCIEAYANGKWNDVPCDEKRNFVCTERTYLASDQPGTGSK